MIDISILLAFSITVFTFLVVPGPVNFIIVKSSNQYGIKKTIWSIVGTNLASLILITISVLAIKGLAIINTYLLELLTIIGGIYLIYYGTNSYIFAKNTLKSDINIYENSTINKQENKSYKLFINSFLIGISSPKDIIFFMSFFPPFIKNMGNNINLNILLLTLVWCVLDYAVLMTYAFFSKKIISKKYEKLLSYFCSITFICIGVYAIYKCIIKLSLT